MTIPRNKWCREALVKIEMRKERNRAILNEHINACKNAFLLKRKAKKESACVGVQGPVFKKPSPQEMTQKAKDDFATTWRRLLKKRTLKAIITTDKNQEHTYEYHMYNAEYWNFEAMKNALGF